ncbi:UNVERIFIED_CONTAM: hypothetical protein PYX00_007106 [Menopon gallinae]|uniref:Mannosyltransferase n=1 Tax=Menopon gallinae TaxID=328185 RepID=A0AAW2HHJ8_9NEOP
MYNSFNLNNILFLLYRLSSVILVQTAYVPDEYWQSLEVAHKMVFGYGYLTWEWKQGLRSYFYPFLISLFYKGLEYLKLDTAEALVIMPRIFQAVLTAISDSYFLRFSKNLGCNEYWTKTMIFTNWFWYFCSSRTILNMFETSLTIIALYYYPWNIVKHSKSAVSSWADVKSQSYKYLTIAAINCIVRPTAITIWGPLVLYQAIQLYPKYTTDFILKVAVPITILISCVSVSIDYLWYEKLVFPPYNFLISNIFSGVASFYGSHPFHWYLTQGIPTILGLHIVPFVLGSYFISGNWRKHDKFEKICSVMFVIILLNIMIFSIIPHKEFRFILPLLPMMEIIGVKFMSNISKLNSKKKLITTLLFIGFIIPSILFGIFHQRGTLTVMSHLSSEASKYGDDASFLFLTPCHATPLYSHLHVNVPVRFLTCDPPIADGHNDESDDFLRKPVDWLKNNWNRLGMYTHIVCFDTVQPAIDGFLKEKGFFLSEKFMHTILTGSSHGDAIYVYKQ